MIRVGSLFSGYGGAELALSMLWPGASPVWFVENDPAPAKVLATHWPDVPNLGDVTAVDWAAVEPVDVLTGGFPCQDVSHAGKRAGLHPDTRSGLWTYMAYAIERLRPRLVVIENVRGLASAAAVGDVEPCPWCVGDTTDGHMRALGTVLADLADLGFDARWTGVRAADAGAPHGRFRIFIAAHPTGDPWRFGDGNGEPATDPGERQLQRPGAAGVGLCVAAERGPVTAADTASATGGRRDTRPQSRVLGGADRETPVDADVAGGQARQRRPGTRDAGRREPVERNGAAAADAGSQRHGPGQDGRAVGRLDRPDEGRARQRQRPRPEPGDRGTAAAADAERGGRDGWTPDPLRGPQRGAAPAGDSEAPCDFGPYTAAVRRWEHTLGRPAPAPTEPSRDGRPRLSPRFVEWLMGLPDGWVTDVGIPRSVQLKALGNGIVPAQMALALRLLEVV